MNSMFQRLPSKAHVTAIFRKLGVQNRTQAVLAISALNIEDKKSKIKKTSIEVFLYVPLRQGNLA